MKEFIHTPRALTIHAVCRGKAFLISSLDGIYVTESQQQRLPALRSNAGYIIQHTPHLAFTP